MTFWENSRRKRTFQPTRQLSEPTPIPAPNMGINAVDSLVTMDPREAIFLYNLEPASYGARVRTGYQEFATNVDGDGVRTIVPFNGADSSNDALFAAGQAGIYDITAGGDTWSVSIAFASTSSTSGYGQWINHTTIGGHFCLYTDEENGYYVYSESGGSWAKISQGTGATQVSGVDPAEFAGVVIFKTRPWFIRKGTAKAYYLQPGSVYGAATEFDFGNKFHHGGTLVNLYSWTVDGGEGIDDYLVAVSSSGDVVVYKGVDPNDAASFSQHGSWYIGPTPIGRRIGGSFGGEVYLLSQYGILPMSKLISGSLTQQQDVYLSRKITPLINEQMLASRTSYGWEIKLIPETQQLLVSAPKRTGFSYTQFVQSLNNEGWSVFLDIPYFSGEVFNGIFYIASTDGIVYKFTGNQDNVDLNGENGSAISFSGLQVFSDLNAPGRFHRSQFIRPVFLASAVPAYTVEARYDYDLDQVFDTATLGGSASGSLWDVAVWDTSVWAGEVIPIQNPVGGSGIGRAIAIGISGTSNAETILVRYDLMADTGGLL